METTLDSFLNGRVTAKQPREGYRAAIDPVLLAAAVPAQAGQRVLELGCGVGVASLCLLARCPELHLTGIEIQEEYAALARENMGCGAHGERRRVLVGDVSAPPPSLFSAPFDHVFMNPPYHAAQAHSASPSAGKNTAHAMESLAGWIQTAHRALTAKGTLTLIHRAEALPALLTMLQPRFGGLEVIPLWPKQGVAAKRVIVRAKKDSRASFILTAGVVLHAAEGSYTAEAQRLLRDGEGMMKDGGCSRD